MSVPRGTLTDEYRAQVLEFYGSLFEWTEIEELRTVDRMTLSVGRRCYVNLRELDEGMTCTGYEHVGLLVESPEIADAHVGAARSRPARGRARTHRAWRQRLPELSLPLSASAGRRGAVPPVGA